MKISIMLFSFLGSFKGKKEKVQTRYYDSQVPAIPWYSGRAGIGLAIEERVVLFAKHLLQGKAQSFNYFNGGYCVTRETESIKYHVVLKTEGEALSFFGIKEEDGVLKDISFSEKSEYLDSAIAGAIFAFALKKGFVMERKDFPTLSTEEDDSEVWEDKTLCEGYGKQICWISNSLYYFMKNEVLKGVLMRVPFKKLYSSKIPKKLYPVFADETAMGILKKREKEETKNTYSLTEGRTFSEEEKALIPTLDERYVLPKWVEQTCEKIKKSEKFPEPFRNVLLIGPAGTGKTKGSKAIAALLGLPYVKLTCSPDTDKFDLVGQLLPNTSDEAEMPAGCPSFEDVDLDFEGTYEKLFGEKPDKFALPSDCYSEIARRSASKKDFKYIESDFIKAIRNGWLVEIQEPTVIKRNAVLVGLNGILENETGSSITLPTGEVIKRHPQCVVVMTTNSEYDGCNNIQQSVLSRIELVKRIDNPTAQILAKRVVNMTSFPDKKMLERMAKTILEASAFSKDKDISDGICGPRELLNWAKMALLEHAEESDDEEVTSISEEVVIRAAIPTVFEKLSQSEEDIEDILTGVFCKEFPMALIQAERQKYYK